MFDSEKGFTSVVVVAARACWPLKVEVETAQRLPPAQIGGTVPSVDVETCAVGVADVLQMIKKYGAPLASVARAIQDVVVPEFDGVVVEEGNSSRASSPTTQAGGVLSTVRVVVAVPVWASAFCNSVLPIFNIKIKAKIKTPVNAVKTVIFPAVSTYRGSS